jgi:hypothetical protein
VLPATVMRTFRWTARNRRVGNAIKTKTYALSLPSPCQVAQMRLPVGTLRSGNGEGAQDQGPAGAAMASPVESRLPGSVRSGAPATDHAHQTGTESPANPQKVEPVTTSCAAATSDAES